MWSANTAPKPDLAASNLGTPTEIALASALFLGTLVLLLHNGSNFAHIKSAELNVTGILLAALSTFPVGFLRRFRLTAFAAIGGASVALAGIGYLLELPIGLTAALYFLTASRPRGAHSAWRTTILVLGALIAYLIAEGLGQQRFPAIVEFHTALVWAVSWFAGERTCLRNERIAQLHDRTLAAEREAERERQFAAVTERARIARDLHDSAGHAISVIAVRAGAARLRHHQDPNRSLRTLEAIEELARHTVEEIDQMVATLREGGSQDANVDAPPGLASLSTLIAERSAAGFEAKLDISGSDRPLATAVDQAVYRIVQEALTNAARHGLGTASVRLAFADGAIELTVTNPVQGNEKVKREGHGLIGMHERATLLGGSFTTDCKDGLFRVYTKIPYEGDQS